MSVLVRIGKHKAILRGAEWRCASASLEEDLNQFTRHWVRNEARSEDLAGNIEDTVAAAATERFGCRILLRVGTSPKASQKRYFPLRQYSLFDF